MRNLIFAGNTVITLSYAYDFDWESVKGEWNKERIGTGFPTMVKNCVTIAPVVATAPRTGRIAGWRSNIALYSMVSLGRLKVGSRVIHESVRPKNYVGMCGVDLAHPGLPFRRTTPFTV